MSTRLNTLAIAAVAGMVLFSTPEVAGTMEMRLKPVAATGNVICLPGEGACGDTEIILSGGGAVTLFLELSGWGTDWPNACDPSRFLGSFQGTVDSDTYLGGSPGNPGTLEGFDLNPVGQDTSMGFEGAFQALKVCATSTTDPQTSSDLLSRCYTNSDCPSGWSCVDRWDYVFYQLAGTAVVSTATIDYSWSAASTDCKEDPCDGSRFYFGTLILEVPSGTRGTYNVKYHDDQNYTLWCHCGVCPLESIFLIPGQITIIPGATDCDGNGVPDEFEPDTDDDGVIDECDGCPNDPNKTEPGGCGCGFDDSPDADGDGVPDCIDECPGVDDAVFAPDCAGSIPAVSAWGVVVMTLLLLLLAKLYACRARTQ